MKACTSLLFLTIIVYTAKVSLGQKRTDIGIKAGISIPNLTSGSSKNPISTGYSSRLDADAAIHIGLQLGNRFVIQPQLEYSSQGGKKNGMQAFTPPAEMLQLFPPGQAPQYLYARYSNEARLNYLMLPVLAKYYLAGKAKRWRAYVAAGPFASFLLSAKNITKGSSTIYLDAEGTQPLSPDQQSFDSKTNVTGDLHRFNAGISGHVGMDYKLGIGSIFLEAGGNFGFIDIQKQAINGKNKTGAAAINLGYQFKL